MKKRVLFVCVHNSARSQMAEAFCNDLGNGSFEAESAGLKPGTLNPHVVEVMKEAGYDISQNECNDVFDFFKQGRRYSYLITVCDESQAEKCPIFPGLVISDRIHWSFPDPSQFQGTKEEILAKTREIRDLIKERISQFINSVDS